MMDRAKKALPETQLHLFDIKQVLKAHLNGELQKALNVHHASNEEFLITLEIINDAEDDFAV